MLKKEEEDSKKSGTNPVQFDYSKYTPFIDEVVSNSFIKMK